MALFLAQCRSHATVPPEEIIIEPSLALVSLPTEHPLRIEGYQVRLDLSHPLFGILVPLLTARQGSPAFEQSRADLEEWMASGCWKPSTPS